MTLSYLGEHSPSALPPSTVFTTGENPDELHSASLRASFSRDRRLRFDGTRNAQNRAATVLHTAADSHFEQSPSCGHCQRRLSYVVDCEQRRCAISLEIVVREFASGLGIR